MNTVLQTIIIGFSLSGGILAMEADWQSELDRLSEDEVDDVFLEMIQENRPLPMIQYLEARGDVDIDFQDEIDANTPLHLAAENDNVEVVLWLIKKGAKLFIKNADELTAKDVAETNTKYIIGQIIKDRYLLAAAAKGDLKIIEEAFILGADVNARDSEGMTAFHKAAGSGHVEVVKFLYKRNTPYLNEHDNKGHDAMYVAIKNGHYEMVEWFVDNFPSRFEANNNKYGLALFWAAVKGYIELVDWLIADYPHFATIIDSNMKWVVYHAKRRGHQNVLDWLKKRMLEKQPRRSVV